MRKFGKSVCKLVKQLASGLFAVIVGVLIDSHRDGIESLLVAINEALYGGLQWLASSSTGHERLIALAAGCTQMLLAGTALMHIRRLHRRSDQRVEGTGFFACVGLYYGLLFLLFLPDETSAGTVGTNATLEIVYLGIALHAWLLSISLGHKRLVSRWEPIVVPAIALSLAIGFALGPLLLPDWDSGTTAQLALIGSSAFGAIAGGRLAFAAWGARRSHSVALYACIGLTAYAVGLGLRPIFILQPELWSGLAATSYYALMCGKVFAYHVVMATPASFHGAGPLELRPPAWFDLFRASRPRPLASVPIRGRSRSEACSVRKRSDGRDEVMAPVWEGTGPLSTPANGF